MHRQLALSALALSCLGCQDLDVTPISQVLKASASLAVGGVAAMAAIAGEAPSCVTLTPACPGAPCAGRVEVELGEACPLALGVGEGTIILDGEWSDENKGIFTPDLTNVKLGVSDGVSLGLGAVVVSRSDDEVRVIFGEQGVDVDDEDDPEVEVGQAGYTVRVDLGGTLSDLSDDTLEVNGGDQTVSGSEVIQLAVALARTEPSCRKNPVEGTATLGGAGDKSVSNTTLFFHAACDGEAEVIASTVDPTLIGRTVPLQLGE